MLQCAGEDSCLSVAAKKGKYRLVRTLLDLGVSANIENAQHVTTLGALRGIAMPEKKQSIAASYILNAGGRMSFTYTPSKYTSRRWVHELENHHKEVRLQTIIMLGLHRCGSISIGCNGKDVLRVIGRVIWSARCDFFE